jgi:hypothetical protein
VENLEKTQYKHSCQKCQRKGWVGGNYENESQLPVLQRLFNILTKNGIIILCEKCLPMKEG